MYHPICLGMSRSIIRHVDEFIKIFTFVCKDCKNRTIPDLIRAVNHVNTKLNTIADKGEKRDRLIKERIDDLSSTVETSIRNPANASFLPPIDNNTEARLDKIVETLEGLSTLSATVLKSIDTRLQALGTPQHSTLCTLETTMTSMETRLSEMCERLSSLGSTALTHNSSASPVSEERASNVSYPCPNEVTPDGGMWMVVGDSRFWSSDLASLKALRAREKAKLRRQTRRRERRREARSRKRQTPQPSQVADDRPRNVPAIQRQRQSPQHPAPAATLPPSQHDQLPGQTQTRSWSQVASCSTHPFQNNTHGNGNATVPEATGEPHGLESHGGEWLYITGLANDITTDVVKQYISARIHRENVDCQLLLPRGVDPHSRRYLSFKIRIPSSCVYVVLQDTFWPVGVSVRRFTAAKDF